jgi:hypothetical protein
MPLESPTSRFIAVSTRYCKTEELTESSQRPSGVSKIRCIQLGRPKIEIAIRSLIHQIRTNLEYEIGITQQQGIVNQSWHMNELERRS